MGRIKRTEKRCPFCGGSPKLLKHNFHGYSPTYGYVCKECNAQTSQFFNTPEEALEAWTKRYKSTRTKEN